MPKLTEMITRLILLFFLSLISIPLFSQTKLIAHKSHSGNTATFKIAIENNLFNTKESNFGMIPDRTVVNSKLDSVVFISDEKAIMITSEYCVKTRSKKTTLWKAGKDTVYSHPLFSHQHSLDSIKNVLKEEYNFKNSIDSVTFIGFDNQKDTCKSKIDDEDVISVPAVTNDKNNNQPPFDNRFPVMLSILFLLSVFAGLLAWKFRKLSFRF